MRFLPLCALAAMSLLLAACLPESEHPVSAADPEHGDPRLWGAWINEAEDGFTVAHVLATEGGTLHLVTIDHDVEGVGGVDEYDGHVSRLKVGDYLNVRVTGSETGYLVAKYRFDGKDKVIIALTETAALEQAVRDGKLAGTFTDEGGTPDLRITATSEQWQAFLAKPPADLYGEDIVFERVGPAYVSE